MAKGIVIKGEPFVLQTTPITGDVAVTPDGVSTIGTGMVTLDMLASAIHKYILPVAVVGQGKVGYCVVAP